MAVTVTTTNPMDETYRETHSDVVHDAGRSISVTDAGHLYVFDHAPELAQDGANMSSLGHTVAVYAPGRWVKAVRS